jgi:hypothetical protein
MGVTNEKKGAKKEANEKYMPCRTVVINVFFVKTYFRFRSLQTIY